MPNIEVKIRNIPQIRAAVAKSPVRMLMELNIAIQKSIFSIGRDSRIKSPVLTGRLRASHYETFAPLRGEVGPNTNYAFFVHEGTRYMRKRPFLLEAVKSNEQRVQDNFTQAVQKTLDELARGF